MTFDEVIAVTRGLNNSSDNNTYLSTNRGDTWHNVTGIWAWWAQSIRSVVQFDGYLWCSVTDFSSGMARSSDNGRTWEWIPMFKYGWLPDWVVLHHRLYAVGELGFGRWNEQTRDWEDLPVEGLPMLSWGFNKTTITSSAVHDDRLYVGVSEFNSNAGEQSGVYVFDSNTGNVVICRLSRGSDHRSPIARLHTVRRHSVEWHLRIHSAAAAPTCEGGHDVGARETERSCERLTQRCE